MTARPSLVGAGVGALVGGSTRAAAAAWHLTFADPNAFALLLAAAIVGILIGALAGLTARPLPGVVCGGLLSVAFFELHYVLIIFLHLVGMSGLPSFWEALGVGVLAGGLGGAAGNWAAGPRRTAG